MAGLALDTCSLVSVFVESVLWGLFLSLYVITIYLLVQKRSKVVRHIPHIVMATLMFFLCTVHISLTFSRVIDAFFRSPHPVVYLQNISNLPFRYKNAIQLIQVFMSDLLIIFRSYMLWDKNYLVVLFPVTLAVATLVTGAGAVHTMSLSSPTDPIFERQMAAWVTATLTLTLVTKAICFFLVVFRVRQIHASMTSHVNRHIAVYTLIVVLVESGAAALLVSIILLPLFVTHKNTQYIVWDALSPTMGIVFTTIISGMTLNLANQGPAMASARPAWNRYSGAPRSPISPRPPKGRWDDSQEDIDTPPSPSSQVIPHEPSMQNLKTTGTLNMAIVI